jgi:hypothetical protein
MLFTLCWINTYKLWQKTIKTSLSFSVQFWTEKKPLFLAPPLRTTSRNVHYRGSILYDNERETWSKSTVEVEMILNSRPLSYISIEDFEESLTPSHLLIGRRLLSLPEPNYNEDDPDFDINLDTDDLTRRMRHLSNVMIHLWSRCRNLYLM